MRDRESTFTQPALRDLLNERFVPVAIDTADYRSSKDADGRFFQAVAHEALVNRKNPDGNRSLQGHYVVHPDGTLLAAHNRRGARPLKRLLSQALAADAKHSASAPLELDARDPDYDRSPPAGSLVLNVYARLGVEESQAPARAEFRRWNAERAGVDHLWVLPGELEALLPKKLTLGESYPGPKALARRLARFHMIDTVRGEAPSYRQREVQEARLEVTLRRVSSEGELSFAIRGRFALEAKGEHPRSFTGELEGELVYDRFEERFLRFDLFTRGTTHGQGRWNPGAPTDSFELKVAVEIPPASWRAPEVAPHAARNRVNYLQP